MYLVHHRGDFFNISAKTVQNYIENRDTQMNTQLQNFLQKLFIYIPYVCFEKTFLHRFLD